MLGLYDAHGEVKVELVRVVEGSVFLVGDEAGKMPCFFLVLVFDVLADDGNVAAFWTEKETTSHGFFVRIHTEEGVEWCEAGWVSTGEHKHYVWLRMSKALLCRLDKAVFMSFVSSWI